MNEYKWIKQHGVIEEDEMERGLKIMVDQEKRILFLPIVQIHFMQGKLKKSS